MITTLAEFIEKYIQICNMGWIKTHRQGPTGIGKTLEDLLGIIENNIDGPDFGDYELKSCRLDSNSMLTIFTKTPQPKGASQYTAYDLWDIPAMPMIMMRKFSIQLFLPIGM